MSTNSQYSYCFNFKNRFFKLKKINKRRKNFNISFYILSKFKYPLKYNDENILYNIFEFDTFSSVFLMITVFFRVNAVFRSFIAVVMGSFIIIAMGAFTTMLRAIFCKCRICFQNYWHSNQCKSRYCHDHN